jgi:hypothetical protein
MIVVIPSAVFETWTAFGSGSVEAILKQKHDYRTNVIE